MYRLRLFVLLVLAVVGLCACSSSSSDSGGKPIIAVTISPTASIIKTLAGDKVEVLELLPEGATPENYEPTMQDMQRLAQAKAWFYIGDLGFEQQWLSRITELNPNLTLIRLDKGLTPLGNEHIHADGTHHKSDPHYWMSVGGMRTMTANAVQGLGTILPGVDCSLGQKAITQQLDSLQSLAQAHTPRSKSFVIYHPSLAYLAHELGVNQLVIEEEGKEPTLQKLSMLIERAKADSVQIMFFQREFGMNAKSADYIEGEIRLKKKLINPFSPDWYGELTSIIQTLQGVE